jgi:hypothetical protein
MTHALTNFLTRLTDSLRLRALSAVTAYDTVRYRLGLTDAIRYWRTLPLHSNYSCGCARWEDSPLCPDCYPLTD